MKKILLLLLLLLAVVGCVEGNPLPAGNEVKTGQAAAEKPVQPKPEKGVELKTTAQMRQEAAGKVPAVQNNEPQTGKYAYLTFDDGPDDTNTEAVLDVLKQENVVGTFYVVGRSALTYPEVVRRIKAEGHAIGNHTYDHVYDYLYASPDNFLYEVERTSDIIEEIAGIRPNIVRAPGGTGGNFTEAYDNILEQHGYVEHDWNVSTADATPEMPRAQVLIDNVDMQTDDGKEHAIILMHCSEGHEETVKALPGIIRVLRGKGYAFRVVTADTPQPW